MNNIDILIRVYVPEAQLMEFEEAARLAVARDEEAADYLRQSAETQLQMERAAAVCKVHISMEKRLLGDLGFSN